jgi:hypothetical protein
VYELFAQTPLVLDPRRPRHDHVLVDATEPRSVLLEPIERRVEGPQPSRGHVVVGLLGAPHVVEFHLLLHRHHVDAVEEGDFVRRAERPALGARAVVTVDVDHQRVVELAEILEVLDHAADLVIIERCVGGEDLDLAAEDLFSFSKTRSRSFS